MAVYSALTDTVARQPAMYFKMWLHVELGHGMQVYMGQSYKSYNADIYRIAMGRASVPQNILCLALQDSCFRKQEYAR